jgi:hypothetical protein
MRRRKVTIPQVWLATLRAMAPGELDSARLRRDLSLLLRRRITLYAAVGAAGCTVVLSVVAATTAPGHATAPATPPAVVDPTAGQSPQQPVTQQPVTQQPSFFVPAQAPSAGSGGGPAAVSGGS